jgi:hypothetical protein
MESDDIPAFAVFAFVIIVWVGWGIWFVVKAYNRTDPWWGRPRRTYDRTRRRQAARDSVDEQYHVPRSVILDMDDANYRAVIDEKRCAMSDATLVLPTREKAVHASQT